MIAVGACFARRFWKAIGKLGVMHKLCVLSTPYLSLSTDLLQTRNEDAC